MYIEVPKFFNVYVNAIPFNLSHKIYVKLLKIIQMFSIGIIHIWVKYTIGFKLRDPFKLEFLEAIHNRVHSSYRVYFDWSSVYIC